MHTQAVEDYLKAVYELGRSLDKVTTSALAQHLDVAPASVTGMVKKLAGLKLVAHQPYKGVTLTEAGEKIALEVIRHHRLVERYLAEALGVPWDRVHEEAEKWEHVLSEDIEDRIDSLLGHPATDPHGSPIPDRDGTVAARTCVPLSEVEAGQAVTVSEVSDRDAELLRYLGELGLYPDSRVEVLEKAPFDGPLTVRVDGREQALGREVARQVRVTQANG